MSTIGIPRSLFYYYFYPLWKTFFNEIGATIVLSPPTSKTIIDSGISCAVDENCFPFKVFYGHVKYLAQQNIDYLFLPRIISIEKHKYICPKFMGIPDMIKAGVEPLPPLISPTIDLCSKRSHIDREILKVGHLFTPNRHQIKRAFNKGLQENSRYIDIIRSGFTPYEAIKIWETKMEAPARVKPKEHLNIAVLGHGYSIYDPQISMNLISKLQKLKCQVMLAENLTLDQINDACSELAKPVFWSLGHRMMGSALHFIKDADVDGIIYITCFGCGINSIVADMMARRIANKPFMILTIDEHTGENGVMTRIEAFIDMINFQTKWRTRSESHLSSLR